MTPKHQKILKEYIDELMENAIDMENYLGSLQDYADEAKLNANIFNIYLGETKGLLTVYLTHFINNLEKLKKSIK